MIYTQHVCQEPLKAKVLEYSDSIDWSADVSFGQGQGRSSA